MRTKIAFGLVAAACLAWTPMAFAQTSTPAPMLSLPSGESVWNLHGEWDVSVENYGSQALDGSYPNVFRITQTGSSFTAIRLRDNPPPSVARSGSTSLQGVLDKDGFQRVEIVTGKGVNSPSKGQISADGKKVVVDNGATIRLTLTRK